MEVKAERVNWSIDKDGTWLHMLIPDGRSARTYAEGLDGKPQRVKITQWREKRSRTANAYAWELLGKLSEALHVPPEEIYRNIIKDVGGNYTTVCVNVEALEELKEMWASHGVGWYAELLGVGARPGMVDVLLYYGSSSYDTAQMARLIDLIIQECRENNIEYLPQDKLEQLIGSWEGRV